MPRGWDELVALITHARRPDHEGENAIGLGADIGTDSARDGVDYQFRGGIRATRARGTRSNTSENLRREQARRHQLLCLCTRGPGCVATGATEEEAGSNLQRALDMHLAGTKGRRPVTGPGQHRDPSGQGWPKVERGWLPVQPPCGLALSAGLRGAGADGLAPCHAATTHAMPSVTQRKNHHRPTTTPARRDR